MRALQRPSVPTLMFVNKIDRTGAGYDRAFDAIRLLAPEPRTDGIGARARYARRAVQDIGRGHRRSRGRNDDALLSAYVDGTLGRRLRAAVAAQTVASLVHPVFFGSALTGAASTRSWPESPSCCRRRSAT